MLFAFHQMTRDSFRSSGGTSSCSVSPYYSCLISSPCSDLCVYVCVCIYISVDGFKNRSQNRGVRHSPVLQWLCTETVLHRKSSKSFPVYLLLQTAVTDRKQPTTGTSNTANTSKNVSGAHTEWHTQACSYIIQDCQANCQYHQL